MSDFTPPELKTYPVGTKVADRYTILDVLGWGGMGLVVKAEDTYLNDEVVALKILYQNYSNDLEILARFRREVLLTRKLSHPNIVRVYDLGKADDGAYFISMEFIEGSTLKSCLEAGAIKFEEATNYLYQIGLGLEYAHSHGVIHRDLKPENMLVTSKGEVKITDFGVARSLISTEKLTQTGDAVGSPIYISPEMISSHTNDHRVDIYALGIMAFELVEGRPPFFSENWVMLAKMHMKDPIPAISSPNLPPWYQSFVEKAAAKEPERRFQRAADFVRFLGEQTGQGGTEDKSTGFDWKWIVIAVLVLALVGVMIL